MTHNTIVLGSLCDLVSEQVQPEDSVGRPYLGLEHLSPGEWLPTAQGHAFEVQSSKFSFQAGDILYGKLRPYLDKAVLAQFAGICTTELLVLRAKTPVDNRFLLAVVHSHAFREFAMAGVTGAHHPRTSWHHIREFEIHKFDPDDRVLIGDVLWDGQMSLAAAKNAGLALTQLKAAAIRDLFTRGLRSEAQKESVIGAVPASWEITDLATLCSVGHGRIQTGPFGSQLHSHEYESEGVGVINPTHLAGNRINHREIPKIATETAARLERHILQVGDILFARRGEIGRLGLVTNAEAGWLCGTGCFLVRMDHPGVLNSFLAHFFSTTEVASWLQSHAAGAIMPNLNGVVLGRLPAAIPRTTEEQEEIVDVLEAIEAKMELHRSKQESLERLFEALLHKLMSGDILLSELDVSASSNQKAEVVA